MIHYVHLFVEFVGWVVIGSVASTYLLWRLAKIVAAAALRRRLAATLTPAPTQ